MNLRISSFKVFKTPAHREFDYAPRYYDERKERLEKTEKEISDRMSNEFDRRRSLSSARFKSRLEENWMKKDNLRRKRRSNTGFLIVLGVLIITMYLVYINLDKII